MIVIEWHIRAEDLDFKEVENNIIIDTYWANLIRKGFSNNSVLFVGKRGSGKTMLLKYLYYECLKNFLNKRRLPVLLSLSAFLAKFSFPKIGAFSEDQKTIASELFKSYFHVIIIEEIFKNIEELKLRPSKDLNLFDYKIKKKKLINMAKTLEIVRKSLKRQLTPNKILKTSSEESRINLGSRNIGFSDSSLKELQIESIEFSVLQSEGYIREAIEDIIESYELKQIIFFFDEIPGLGYLQDDFFDILYIFRDMSKVCYKIGSYPHYINMGQYFDTPDDAEKINMDRRIFEPKSKEFYDYFISITAKVLDIEINNINKYLEDNAIKLLSIASGGNPRMFLTFLRALFERTDVIKISDIDKNINNLYNLNFAEFLENNANRYSVSYNTCLKIIYKIAERLKDRNNKRSGNTTFIGIQDNLYRKYKGEIDLLNYSRILDFYDKRVLSGNLGVGRRYLLNMVVGGAFKIFKYGPNISNQILEPLLFELEEMRGADRKITISGFGDEIEDIEESKKIEPMEKSISLLGLSNYIHELLISAGFKTISELNDDVQANETFSLTKIKGIGKKRASLVISSLEEYISDNFI